MNNKDKQLIADYMELIFNPARMSLYEYKDGREFKFNSTDASFCVQEMQKCGENYLNLMTESVNCNFGSIKILVITQQVQ